MSCSAEQSFVEFQKPHCAVMTEHGQVGLKSVSDCLLKQAKDNIKSCLKWAREGHGECPWEVRELWEEQVGSFQGQDTS